jgi:hypothetical protein
VGHRVLCHLELYDGAAHGAAVHVLAVRDHRARLGDQSR